MHIKRSAARYERWLRRTLEGDIDEDDLAEKHRKMAEGAFPFLRATYWRWAETIHKICPGLKGAPQVLSVGDIHIENFGTWRDAEGRLVWGVNDFDEAARMPYTLDLARLATSAVLANVSGIAAQAICERLLAGYEKGIKDPKPIVLDRDNGKLRQVAVVNETERKDFWKKFDPSQIDTKLKKAQEKGDKRPKVRPAHAMRRRYRAALERGRPAGAAEFDYYERTAGAGSLGRRRYVGIAVWQGDLIVREAKAVVPSGWALAHGGVRKLRCGEIAGGRFRSPDPYYALHDDVLVRRLSPNDFKIESKPKGAGKAKDKKAEAHKLVTRAALVNADMLDAMGRDLAAIHRGTRNRRVAILEDLQEREAGWLDAAVAAAKAHIESDFRAWVAAFAASAAFDKRKSRATTDKTGRKRSK
jgi:uncharacterized protein (DUF2252 family)